MSQVAGFLNVSPLSLVCREKERERDDLVSSGRGDLIHVFIQERVALMGRYEEKH